MESGSYFGELALLTKEPRKATCKVVSKEATAGGKRFNISHKTQFYNTDPLRLFEVKLEVKRFISVLDVNAFERLLGPCKELMSRKIDHYAEEIANLKMDD